MITDEEINLTIIVINNDGGGIFSTLSQRGVPGFEKVFGTPHGKDLAAIAHAMGIPAKTISTSAELKNEIQSPINGVRVVVVKTPDRESNADVLQQLFTSIKALH